MARLVSDDTFYLKIDLASFDMQRQNS